MGEGRRGERGRGRGRGGRGGGAGKWDARVGGKSRGPGLSRWVTRQTRSSLHKPQPGLPAYLASPAPFASSLPRATDRTCTRVQRPRRHTLLLQTGTAVETSHMGIKVETSHIFYTQARRPRCHTLIHMGTAAVTSHTVTHGHSGRDVTHCYTRARWPGRHTLLHMGTAVETLHIVTHGQND